MIWKWKLWDDYAIEMNENPLAKCIHPCDVMQGKEDSMFLQHSCVELFYTELLVCMSVRMLAARSTSFKIMYKDKGMWNAHPFAWDEVLLHTLLQHCSMIWIWPVIPIAQYWYWSCTTVSAISISAVRTIPMIVWWTHSRISLTWGFLTLVGLRRFWCRIYYIGSWRGVWIHLIICWKCGYLHNQVLFLVDERLYLCWWFIEVEVLCFFRFIIMPLFALVPFFGTQGITRSWF
jgi:hypothetical protein